MNGRNFVVVAHRLYPMGGDDLVAYLNSRGADNVLFITHSFSEAKDRRSEAQWFRRGKLIRRSVSRDYMGVPEPVVYAKEMLFTWRSILRHHVPWDRLVALDGLCTSFGLAMRRAGRVRLVDYWAMDFVPQDRFVQGWKNTVYAGVNRFAALNADEMWDLSETMSAEKARLANIRPEDCRSHRIVPIGAWIDRSPHVPFERCEKTTLVFMGHLLEKQGVQLVLRATPKILAQVPDFTFKVIGDGEYLPALRSLARDLDVEHAVEFAGAVTDHEELERRIGPCAAAIAPYIGSLDRWTKHGADPGKVKTYLGCGVPTLITNVSWIASTVESAGCGTVIDEDPDDIAAKVIALLSDGAKNQRARDACIELARRWDWTAIFDSIGL